MTTYTMISQNTKTGKITESQTYDNLRDAEEHYRNYTMSPQHYESHRLIETTDTGKITVLKNYNYSPEAVRDYQEQFAD